MNSLDLEKALSGIGRSTLISQHEPAPPPVVPVTIALSRESGAPGTSVARAVGARLGWDVYDHELLQSMARDMGRSVHLLEAIDERRQSWLRGWVEAWGGVPQVSESWYVRHLVESILRLGTKGHCVIVGRGATVILPAETTLRVRLTARREDRIAVIAQRYHLDDQAGERKMDEIDRERVEFVRKHFHKDLTDPQLYDAILNASRWSVADCAETIAALAQKMEKRS
jgi:cytidylate kinase